MNSLLMSYREMEPNLSLYEDKLKFYFVAIENDQSMLFAREKLSEHVQAENIINITEVECEHLIREFTRKSIVIFGRFEGDCFNKVAQSSALVLGARCVISGLMDNNGIPNVKAPIFNLAMRNLVICMSAISAQEKLKFRQLVNFMGGHCIDQLVESVTHLITDSVKTKKYEMAVVNNMKIMKTSWVHDVWRHSCEDNISALSEQFDCHKLPAFFNLNVTTSGLNRKDKGRIEELVNQNGGKYYAEFSTSIINIVIAKKNATETDKLKAALTSGKDCLRIEWVSDSVERGCALPFDDYHIELQASKKTSTPTKRNSQMNASTASIELSHIQYSVVNETAVSNMSCVSDVSFLNRGRKSHETVTVAPYKSILDKITMQEVKKAGTFLDGCCIYMLGFAPSEKDKIVKILNSSGATRYDTINSKLTHILYGNPTQREISSLAALKTEHQAYTVSFEWLAESMSKKAVCDADAYLVRLNSGKPEEEIDAAPSPASKQNILSMSNIGRSANRKRLNFDEKQGKTTNQQNDDMHLENVLIDEYANAQPMPPKAIDEPTANKSSDVFKMPAAAEPLNQTGTESQFDSEYGSTLSEPVTFLANMKVFIHGFDEESTDSLVEDCELAGANVIKDANSTEAVDYLILPLDAMNMNDIKVKPQNIVNHNWLINAKRANQRTDIPYFYKPVFFPEELKPLTHMIIVFSLYTNDERSFLVQLSQILGAEVQDSYVRARQPVLVCPEPKSAKYDAAIRWNLSVVTRAWLLECYNRQKRVPIKDYLVGDSIAPIDDIDDDDEIVSSQAINEGIENNINENFATPVNRRLEQLRNGKGAKSGTRTPGTPDPYAYLAEIDTPVREEIKQVLRELENETPQSKRRRFEEEGIHTPEYATTPALLEMRRQTLEEHRNRYLPTESEKKKEMEKTPWTEYKRRFWKEALGDDYGSPSMCYTANTQDVSHVNDTMAPKLTGRQLNYDPPNDAEADRNLQKLNEFISNRPKSDDNQIHQIILPESMTIESELPNSEMHEVVGWRDPSEATVSRMTMDVDPPKVTRIFTLSCPSEELRNELIMFINQLGGKVSEDIAKFDNQCTHILSERPSRSEKVLSCIAAGKWFMCPDYILKSVKNGAFLDEESFEWGNPKAAKYVTSAALNASEDAIAKAAYRWRLKVQSTRVGVFAPFNVILRTSKNSQLITLLEAGDGKIINIPENDRLTKHLEKLTEATHVICQARITKLTADELNALNRVNVPCINMAYLNACIMNDTFPDASQYTFKQNN